MIVLVNVVTNFGDLAVLLPMMVVMTLWLIALGRPLTVVWWFVALAFCISVTAILKVSFFVCPPLSDLHSPSGHTSLSTVVYGSLTLAVAANFIGWRRVAITSAGAVFIVGIGISRILLQAHSIDEVVAGSVIGAAALALFGPQFWRHRPADLQMRPLVVVSVLLAVMLNGQNLRAEDTLHAIGVYLNHAGMVCL